MADYALIDMDVRGLLADILRTDVPPPGALGWGFLDDNGELIAVSLADLSSPAAPGTGLASATYEVGTAGAQTIRQPTATWFGDVGIVAANGKSIPLSFGTGYTFVAGTLTILAVAGAVPGDTITYTYASGVVGGQQPAPGYTPPAIVATVAGEEVGFATLADAIAARPSAIYQHEDIELSTVTARFDGVLFGGGHVITLATSGQLRLGRNASLYNGLAADGGGSIAIVGNGVPAGGSVPAPAECVQVFDYVIEAALNLSATSAYQGFALRGNSVVSNLASGGGPVYLFDLAEVSGAIPAGFTIINRRPGSLGNSVNVLVLEGSTGTFSNATGVGVGANNQFVFLPINDLRTNYQNSWDTVSRRLRIPVSGSYLVSYNVLPENSPQTGNHVGKDFFGGPATGTAADSPDGKWESVSQSKRASASRTVVKHYNAGEMVGLAHYQENADFNILCSLSFTLLKAD